jgi:hypothetical protein
METLPLVDKNSDDFKLLSRFINETWGSVGKDGTYPPFFPGPQPISIERKHITILNKKPYLACEKSDGTRIALVCVGWDSKRYCVAVNRAMDMRILKVSLPRAAYRGTILDTELVQTKSGKPHLMVYDGILISGTPIKHNNLTDRLEQTQQFVSSIMKLKSDKFVIKLKTFYPLDSMDQLIRAVKSNDFDYENDGLIFTPIQEPVRMGTHETLFKWKERDKNTIDFLVKERDDGTLGLYIQDRGELVFSNQIPSTRLENTPWADTLKNDVIVECQYQWETWPRWWMPVNIRTDKHHPNNRRTLYRTMVNIEENIQIQEFQNLKV